MVSRALNESERKKSHADEDDQTLEHHRQMCRAGGRERNGRERPTERRRRRKISSLSVSLLILFLDALSFALVLRR